MFRRSSTAGPHAFVQHFGDFALQYRLRYFITDFSRRFETDGEVRRRLWYRFRRHGIQVPFPMRTLVNETPLPEEVRRDADAHKRAHERALAECPIFSGMGDRMIRRLAEGLVEVTYSDGEAIVHEGETFRSFFLLRKGRCALFRKADGKEIPFGEMQEGDFFGEYALLTGEPRRATVRAKGEALLFRLDAETMQEVIRDNPAAAEILSRALAERVPPEIAAGEEKKEDAQFHRKILDGISRLFGMGGAWREPRIRV